LNEGNTDCITLIKTKSKDIKTINDEACIKLFTLILTELTVKLKSIEDTMTQEGRLANWPSGT
jgi:hypothetical protein